jgi:hypothetical protein
MPLSIEQAQALRDKGMITPETFAMVEAQQAPPMMSAAPPLASFVPSAAPPPMPPPQAAPAPPPSTALPSYLQAGNADPTLTPPPPALEAAFQAQGLSLVPKPDPYAEFNVPAQLSRPAPVTPQVEVASSAAPSVPHPAASHPGPVAQPIGTARTNRKSGAELQVQAQNDVLSGERKSQEEINRLERTRAVEEADARRAQQDEADQRRILDLADKQAETRHRDDLIAQRTAAIDEFRSAKIDPARLAKERGPLGNLVAALATGLGAFGSSMGGGPNYAMQILDKQVERDIASQEAELSKKGRAVDVATNSVAQYRQILGDNEAARAAAKSDLYSRQRDQITSLMSKYGDEQSRVRGEQALVAIDGKKAENEAILQQRKEALAAQQAAAASATRKAQQAKIGEMAKDFTLKGDDPYEAQRKAVAYVTGNVVGAGPLKAIPDREKVAVAEEKRQERMVNVNGKAWEANTPDDAKELKKATITYEKLNSGLARLRELREKHGGGTIWNRTDIAEAKALGADLTVQLKNAYELGALSGSDYALIRDGLPADPLEYSPLGSTDTLLSTLQGRLQSGYQAQLAARLRGGTAPPITAEAKSQGVGFIPNK